MKSLIGHFYSFYNGEKNKSSNKCACVRVCGLLATCVVQIALKEINKANLRSGRSHDALHAVYSFLSQWWFGIFPEFIVAIVKQTCLKTISTYLNLLNNNNNHKSKSFFPHFEIYLHNFCSQINLSVSIEQRQHQQQ